MKSKGTIITIGIIVILTAIYVVQQRFAIIKSTTGSYSRLLPEGFTPIEVYKIELYRGKAREKGVILKKVGGIWRVVNFEERVADNQRVTDFIVRLENMEGELRASGTDLFPEFLIDDEAAVHIVLYDEQGAEYLHMLVGKREPVFGKRFVRFKSGNNVYLTDKKLSFSVGSFGDNNEKDPDHMQWLGQ